MLFVRSRRRFRNLFVKFLITLASFFLISFLIRSNLTITTTTSTLNDEKHIDSRLFCILLNTQSTHEQFVYMVNITWAKHCHRFGVVRYRKLQGYDQGAGTQQSPYYVNVWIRILDIVRQSITSNDISTNDILIIVPAPTFIFREKLSLLLQNLTTNRDLPLFLIHKEQELNSYILNDKALNLLRNTQVIDSCLQQSYPSARESHLWKCVKSSLNNEETTNSKCKHENCFIHNYYYQLTLKQIKNGFCLQKNHSICQSIALLFPITLNDFVTLEFFKYRLKSKSTSDL